MNHLNKKYYNYKYFWELFFSSLINDHDYKLLLGQKVIDYNLWYDIWVLNIVQPVQALKL